MKKSTLWSSFIKPLSHDKIKVVVDEITPMASPGFDYFLLVILSGSIATLGLITNSPAVIIGAMLVAPLMSPLIGIGLASVIGNTGLLKKSLSALFRGALLAVALSVIITLANNALPFFSMEELSEEILVRTRPSPIDLVIALAGGIAAAYALTQPNLSAALPGVAIATALMPPLCTIGIGIASSRWDVAGGATLLFITNAVTIAFASVLVFFLRGFSSKLKKRENGALGGLILAGSLTVLLLIPLTFFSLKFFRQASENRLIYEVIAAEVDRLPSAELVSWKAERNGTDLNMAITLRTGSSLRYEQVVALQKAIVEGLNQPVSLKVSQVIAENLDPLIPPTATVTPSPTSTTTPGPSPTATFTPTFTPTTTATSTHTPTSTATQVPTSTPAEGIIVRYALPEMKIYQSPGGPGIGTLRAGQKITALNHQVIVNGLTWIEIVDQDGRVGWIPEIFMQVITPLPIVTSTVTMTPSAVP